ncbi:hypothetical protein ACWGKQ_30960 [Streptomyces sp. NPDC054770]
MRSEAETPGTPLAPTMLLPELHLSVELSLTDVTQYSAHIFATVRFPPLTEPDGAEPTEDVSQQPFTDYEAPRWGLAARQGPAEAFPDFQVTPGGRHKT